MRYSIYIILIFCVNAYSDMVASDVDMAPAIADISSVVVAVVGFLAFIMGSKRILRMLG